MGLGWRRTSFRSCGTATIHREDGGDRGDVLFSSRRRADQAALGHPYPPGLYAARTTVVDAAFASDGAFAVALHYGDDLAPGGVIQAVMLGHLDDDSSFIMWYPPFDRTEAALEHIGWDGEAFALHAIDQADAGGG